MKAMALSDLEIETIPGCRIDDLKRNTTSLKLKDQMEPKDFTIYDLRDHDQ